MLRNTEKKRMFKNDKVLRAVDNSKLNHIHIIGVQKEKRETKE